LSSSIFLVPPFDKKVVARFERERERVFKVRENGENCLRTERKEKKERKKSSSKNRAGEKHRERERDVFRVTDTRDTRVMMRLLYE
tara:strand:+ start:1464 stop:1721 length:258 start_codon:yes stop_codon:yes gene_type:complete